MPILQIRDLPMDLYKQLKILAKKEHRSLSQQALAVLERGLMYDPEGAAKRQRRALAMEEALERKIDGTNRLTDPVDLLREDRKR